MLMVNLTALHIFRFFPKIFGEKEDLPLDKQGTLYAFEKLTEEVILVFALLGKRQFSSMFLLHVEILLSL